MVTFVFPLVQHSWVGCTLHNVKVKYSGFGFGGSRVSLKVCEAVCVPRDLLLHALVYLKGPAPHWYWLGLAYPIVCCGLIL